MCFYVLVSLAVCLVCSFETICQFPRILKLIKRFGVFIEKSAYNLILSFYFNFKLTFLSLSLLFLPQGSRKLHSATIHNKLVGRIERLSEWIHLLLVKVSTIATMITPLLVTFTNFFIFGMGDESFQYDGVSWMPFDANTPFGLLVALVFQTVAAFADLCLFTPIGCVFIGSCWTIVTFLKDIAIDISHLKSKQIANLSEQQLTGRFCRFVQFHTEVEQLSVFAKPKN